MSPSPLPQNAHDKEIDIPFWGNPSPPHSEIRRGRGRETRERERERVGETETQTETEVVEEDAPDEVGGEEARAVVPQTRQMQHLLHPMLKSREKEKEKEKER